MYKEAIDSGKYNKLLIICKESLLDIDYINKFALQGRMEIWTFEELKKKIHLKVSTQIRA